MEVPTLHFTPPQLHLDLWLPLAQELGAQSKAAFLLLLPVLPPRVLGQSPPSGADPGALQVGAGQWWLCALAVEAESYLRGPQSYSGSQHSAGPQRLMKWVESMSITDMCSPVHFIMVRTLLIHFTDRASKTQNHQTRKWQSRGLNPEHSVSEAPAPCVAAQGRALCQRD